MRRVCVGSVIGTGKSGKVRNNRRHLMASTKHFRDAVGRQATWNVDFGVFLSGGLDSSLVSAVARALHPTRR